MATPSTCAFCGTGYGSAATACPKCGYPADGTFGPPAEPAAEKRRAPRKARRQRQPATCAHCGQTFPAGRPACPHCGADAATGWKTDDEIDEAAATIPEFDEEDYRRTLREADAGDVTLWTSRQFRMIVIGVILVAAMVVPLLLALRRLP